MTVGTACWIAGVSVLLGLAGWVVVGVTGSVAAVGVSLIGAGVLLNMTAGSGQRGGR